MVDLAVLDAVGACEPVLNIGNGNGDVQVAEFKSRVVIDGLSIVNIWVVYIVPVGLILSSSPFEVVSKGGTLDERITSFFLSKLRISFFEGMQDFVSSIESVGILL